MKTQSHLALLLCMHLSCLSFAQETKSPESMAQRSRRSRTAGLEIKPASEFYKERERVYSGPQPGEQLPSFKVVGLHGKSKDQTVELSANNDSPHIYIFQDESPTGVRGLLGVARIINQLNQKAKRKIGLSCVFLAEDREQFGQFASRFSGLLADNGMEAITVSPDGRDGPGKLGLNRNVAQTVLILDKGKVQYNFTFNQAMLYPDPHFLGAVAESFKASPETILQWLNDGQQNARNSSPRIQATTDQRASAKIKLRAKLEKFVSEGKLSKEEAIELFQTAFPPSAR